MPVMNSTGQAAVTDSLYFILIVTFLSIFLFGFSSSYGNSIKEQVNNEFNTTFATNALKSILYSSTPRDPDDSIENKGAEIDYLLAILKEDYADNELIDESERMVLGKTISKVLSPVQDTLDYALYISVPSEKKVVFFYLHLTNFKKKPYSASLKELSEGESGRYYVYSPDPDSPHADYFCAIGHESGDYDALSVKLPRLLANVGPVSQASSSIKLVKELRKGEFDDFKAQVDLVLWDAAWLGKTDERETELFPYATPAAGPWNCVKVES